MRLLSCFGPCLRKCTYLEVDGPGRGSPEAPLPPPIMESFGSEALTNTGPVRILSGDAQPWRVACPQDQSLLSQLNPGCLTPVTWLGEGAYGCVELCRVSVPVPFTPHGEDSSDQQPVPRQRSSTIAAGDYSTATSQPTSESCEDPAALSNRPSAPAAAAAVRVPNPAAATGCIIPTTAAAAAAATCPSPSSGAGPSLREEVVVRPGRFSVHRLRLTPPLTEPSSPSPCATPHVPSRLTRLATHADAHLSHRHHGPLRASAPAGSLTIAVTTANIDTTTTTAAGSFFAPSTSGVSLAAGASPAGAPSGAVEVATTATTTTTTAGAVARAPVACPGIPGALCCSPTAAMGASLSARAGIGIGFGGGGTGGLNLGNFLSRPRSSSSTSAPPVSGAGGTYSTPPSAPASPAPPRSSASAVNPSTPFPVSATAAVPMVLSNELVVAVKRVGYRQDRRSYGGIGGCEPDGCVACTGGAGRGRGRRSRTRLSRMQAIELLQLSRCRDCPFIVRVFGCVQDEPRSATGTTGGGGVGGNGGHVNGGSATGVDGGGGGGSVSPSKQSPRMMSKLSPRWRAPPPQASSSSSSAPSCRIVMEWAEGGDLGSFLKALAARRGPSSDPSRERLLMSEASARFYLACLIEALSFLHRKGLMHRDVKPANLLLTSDGRAKLGDLGMVCHLDKDGTAAGRAGTPNYMAPEVWAYGTGPKYSSYGANADLWSAGVVLYEMLTGHLPASHPDEYLRRSWTFTPRQSALSPELRDLLGRLLMPRPRRRLQSCAEVAAHPWFAGFDWQGLRKGTLQAPYVPAEHRPPSTAAARLRLTPAAAAAAAPGITACGGGDGGGGVKALGDGMPPLLEENGAPAAAMEAAATAAAPARGGRGGGVSLAAAAAAVVKAIFRKPSAGALRQSDATTGSTATATAITVATSPAVPSVNVSTRAAAAPMPAASASAATVTDLPTVAAGAHPPPPRNVGPLPRPRPSAAAARAGHVYIWPSLGQRPAAARAFSAAPASAPVSTCSSTASTSLPSAWVVQGRAGPCSAASHVTIHDCGGGGSSSLGPLGFWGAALASAISPIMAYPKPYCHHSAAAASDASGGACGVGVGGTSEMEARSDCDVTNRSGSVIVVSTDTAATAATVAEAASRGRRCGCGGDGGGSGPAAAAAAQAVDGRAMSTPPASCDLSSLLLSTAATAGPGNGDCVPLHFNSGISITGRSDFGGSANLRGGGELLAFQPKHAAGVSRFAAASSSSELPSMSERALMATVTAKPQAVQSLCLPLPPSGGDCARMAGHSEGGAVCSAARPSAAAAAVTQSVRLRGALASLQQHVHSLGPLGRQAGGWVQQRLADAAALAASALPDQLHSAAYGDKPADNSAGCGHASTTSADGAGQQWRQRRRQEQCKGELEGGDGVAFQKGAPVSLRPNRYAASGGLYTAAAALRRSAPAFISWWGGGGGGGSDSWTLGNELRDKASPRGDGTWLADDDHENEDVGDDDDDDGDDGDDARWSSEGGLRPTTCNGGAAEPSLASRASGVSCGKPVDAPHHNGSSSGSCSRSAALPLPLPAGLFELTRDGSDSATVVVRVRRSTGCGGGAADVTSGAVLVGLLSNKAAAGPSRIAAGGSCGGRGNGGGSPRKDDSGSMCYTLRTSRAIGRGFAATAAAAAVGDDAPASPGSPSLPPPPAPPPAAHRINGPSGPVHARIGSFCFDPLDQGGQGRAARKPFAGSPTKPRPSPPSPPPPSPSPSSPGQRPSGLAHQRGKHAGSTSFSFDVAGLLSAGLLISASSPVKLASGGARGSTSTAAAADPGSAAAASDLSALRRSRSVRCGAAATPHPSAPVAAMVAFASTTTISAATVAPPAPQPRARRQLAWPLGAAVAKCSHNLVAATGFTQPVLATVSTSSGPSQSAAAAGAPVPLWFRRHKAKRTLTAAAPADADYIPLTVAAVAREKAGGVAAAAAARSCRTPLHQWQAGDAAVLLYAACVVAVLVVAWALFHEGSRRSSPEPGGP